MRCSAPRFVARRRLCLGTADMDKKSRGNRDRGTERRAHQRLRVLGEVALRRDGSANYRVCLFDLSPAGCKVEIVERPRVTEGIWVKFDGLEAVHAHVLWVEPPVAGLQFDRPIHPAVFDVLMTKFT